MTVTIPDALRGFVSAQIATGQYADVDELICALLRKEQAKEECASIDRQLLEALDGESSEMTAADWTDVRDELHRRHAQRSDGRG